METKIQALTQAIRRGWTLTVDGSVIAVSEMAVLENPKFGRLTYGKNPAGNYDGWAWHEPGGGGSVVAAFTMINHALYIGHVTQPRLFQSDAPVDNVVRGFLDPGQNHFQAASAELEQEAGIVMPVIDLGGGGNPNSTFFETWGEGEGIHFWGVYVPTNMLDKSGDVYVFSPGVVKAAEHEKDGKMEKDKDAEAILGSKFVPWTVAAGFGDMNTLSSITRLLAYLEKVRAMSATFGDFDPEIARFVELRHDSPEMAAAMLNLVDMAKIKK